MSLFLNDIILNILNKETTKFLELIIPDRNHRQCGRHSPNDCDRWRWNTFFANVNYVD